MYFPLNYEHINVAAGLNSPSSIKSCDNKSFWYWQRALFQRAAYRIEFDLPETWQGRIRDFFLYCLYRFGFVAISKNDKYGQFFQACTLSGYDFYYQPTRCIISNPDYNAELEIGKECEILKLTPDYMGIFDIIDFYATQLSELDNAINIGIINSKYGFIIAAKNKQSAETLKKAMDNINSGEPMVIYDKKALCPNDPDDGEEPWQIWERGVDKNSYYVPEQLQDRQTLLNAFDNEIGIPTIPYQKKERMVTEEAASRINDSQSRVSVWLDTLTDSIKEVKKLYPDIRLEARLRELDDYGNDDNLIEGGAKSE